MAKLLLVINHMDWFWSHRLPLAEGARDAGFDVGVACAQAGTDPDLAKHRFHGYELPAGNILQVLRHTRRTIKQAEPDIVHAITLKYAFIAGLASIGLKTARVHTIAGLGYLFSGDGIKPKVLRAIVCPFLKLALRNSKLIFQNPDDMKLLLDRGLAKPEQCHLIRGSGVDVAQFSPVPQAERDELSVMMPTRLVHEKGVAVFVEAARVLKSRGVNARFQLAGGISTTNPNAITQSEMDSMVADGAVEWLGKVSDMPALLAKASLVAYPSHYREGVPKVLLEAAAMGKAIVTTDHPGCREAVRDGYNGLLVPIKDPVALADAIVTLLEDPERRETMGKNSRELAVNEFSATLIVEQTLAVYTVDKSSVVGS